MPDKFVDVEALVHGMIGERFSNVSQADQRRAMLLISEMVDLKQKPVKDHLDRITTAIQTLLDIVSRGSTIVVSSGQGQTARTPETYGDVAGALPADLLAGMLRDLKTNIDAIEVSTGQTSAVDGVVEQLKRLQAEASGETR